MIGTATKLIWANHHIMEKMNEVDEENDNENENEREQSDESGYIFLHVIIVTK